MRHRNSSRIRRQFKKAVWERGMKKMLGKNGGRMKTWSDYYSLSHFYCLPLSLSSVVFRDQAGCNLQERWERVGGWRGVHG